MCRVVEGCAPGVALVVAAGLTARRACAADVLADIGVERGAHACQATGLVNAETSAQACRFCGLVSRLATFPGSVRHLPATSQSDVERRCWSGLVVGMGVWRVEAGGL